MKAKHTPTPWVIEGELDHLYVVNNESKDERACDGVRQICHVGQGGWEYLDYDEALANAKLIAAAPAMLDALKSCEAALAVLRKNNRWDVHPEDFNDDVDEAIDAQEKARAAIKKATK